MPKQNFNKWGQTEEWEDECIKTRRSKENRNERLHLFKIKKTDKVLDLGCGDGLNMGILSSMGVKSLTGIDISAKLLKIAKEENPKAKFFQASAEKLPFKNNTFDIVLVDSVFHHLLSYKKSLNEIYRVLKKNGRLCFIEPHQTMVRRIMDGVCELPYATFLPFIGKRAKSYLGEIKFMKHWLATENNFYFNLEDIGFKENLKKLDFLSIVGIYKK